MTEPAAFAGRVLILGSSGMLGHSLLRELSAADGIDTVGTARTVDSFHGRLPDELLDRVVPSVDALDLRTIDGVLDQVAPDVLVNCVGVIKQDPGLADAAVTVRLNALLPHELADRCQQRGIRLIHVSTDCVFSGRRGSYLESDVPDPVDFYGRSKLLGETTAATALTLRTSIVGHELGSSRSLIDWFLSQSGTVNGFTQAIYSGVTTTELARMLVAVVLPRPELVGLVHVASKPISKFDLLQLVAAEYDWHGEIVPHDAFRCDRSLSAALLKDRTGYEPPPWPTMIAELRRSAEAAGLRGVEHR